MLPTMNLFSANHTDELAALETDVMRFMAIIGFCLMLIFAVVPAAPTQPKPAQPEVADIQAQVAPAPLESAAATVANSSGENERSDRQADSEVVAPAANNKPEWQIQFDSDEALLQLMAKKQVSLFAKLRSGWVELSASGEVQPVKAPERIHGMTPETVPAILIERIKSHDAQWGVVLSPLLQTRLFQAMQKGNGGKLLIKGDAQVALEDFN